MSKNEIDWPKPIPGFSVLKMKQEIQEKIYNETKDLTSEEALEYFRKGSERFDEKMKRRREELEAQ